MINFSPLIDPNFWFDLTPAHFSPAFDKAFFLTFGLLIIFGAVARIVARHKKDDRHLLKLYIRIGRMLLTMGLLGMLYFFFTYEEVYLFSARFWFAIWLIAFIVWIISIIRFGKVTIPRLREAEEVKHLNDQYLPRRNKK